jgi:hypothetical protein
MSDVPFEGSTTIRPPRIGTANTTTQFHQWLDKEPTMNVKVEKNSRGFNYEATVLGARSVEEAVALLQSLTTALSDAYGSPAGAA